MKLKMMPKILLAATTIVLLLSLAANVHFCSQQAVPNVDSLQEEVMDLQSQLSNLNSQASNLHSENANLASQAADLESQASVLIDEMGNLQDEKSKLTDENANLQNQLTLVLEGKAPAKLVARLGANDMRYNYSGQDIRLYITGEVCNVGTETAFNSSLHVTLYQGTNVAVDTYIQLGDLAGGSFTVVARNIYYTGEALSNWTITPEFS